MRRFYAPKDNIAGSSITLDQEESYHSVVVLRAKAGDVVQVFDGDGHEYLCKVDSADKRTVKLVIERSVDPAAPESPCDITLAAALLKKDKFDLVIQKSVELGIRRFVPLITKRCEVSIDRAEKQADRWERIALDAAKQCGRAKLMTVDAATDLSTFLANDNKPEEKLFFSERDGGPLSITGMPKKISVVIGPVGGWDDGEIDMAAANGYQIVTFGGRILRADTAAVSIATILQHRFGDIN